MSLVNFGHEDGISGNNDSGNSDIIIAQRVALASAGTLQSLSFYIETIGGDLALALYAADGPTAPDGLGPGPGTLLDRVAAFTPTAGWNTQSVVNNASLSIGNYWLAYEPQSGTLAYALFTTATGHPLFYNRTYNGSFDSTFSASPTDINDTIYWSFYGTVDTGGGGGGGSASARRQFYQFGRNRTNKDVSRPKESKPKRRHVLAARTKGGAVAPVAMPRGMTIDQFKRSRTTKSRALPKEIKPKKRHVLMARTKGGTFAATKPRVPTMVQFKHRPAFVQQQQKSKGQRHVLLIAPALSVSGTSFTRIVSDAINASAAQIRKVTGIRIFANSLNASEGKLRPGTWKRILANQISGSEGSLRPGTWKRIVANQVSISELVGRVRPFIRVVGETLSMVESTFRQIIFLRFSSNTMQGSETRLRVGAWKRIVANQGSISEARLRLGFWARIKSDTANMSETRSRIGSWKRLAPNTIQGSEAFYRPMIMMRFAADQLRIIGANVNTLSTVIIKIVNDVLRGTETRARVGTFLRFALNTLQASESTKRGAMSMARAGTDTLRSSDSIYRQVTMKRIVGSTLTMIQKIFRLQFGRAVVVKVPRKVRIPNSTSRVDLP